jgi:hypothetical protein
MAVVPYGYGSTVAGLDIRTYRAASQGPGGGPGTASASTQLVMAIVIYGGVALLFAAGLIGLLKRRL